MAPTTPEPHGDNAPGDSARGESTSGQAAYSLDAARDACGGDEELLMIVARAFLDDSPQLLNEVRDAVEANDAPNLRAAAHALKGCVRYYGDTPAYQLAYQLETAGAAGQLAQAGALVGELEREISQLRRILTPLADSP